MIRAHVADAGRLGTLTDEETLLAAGFDAVETRLIMTGGKMQRECAEYVLKHGSGPEDERALAVVRRLMGQVGE